MIKEELVLWWFIFLSPIVFVICLIHAYKTNKKDINLLISGSIFGYFLEFSSIKLFEIYYYNPNWPLNPWQLPITVSVSWANFIYGSHLLVNITSLEKKYKPLAQSIFATTLDWGMDPIAVRSKMWTWTINENEHGYSQQYYGIPWANFFGWMTAVFAFTYAYQFFSQRSGSDMIDPYTIGFTFLFSVIGAGLVNGLYNLIFLEGKPTDSGGRWIFLQGIVVVLIYFVGLLLIIIQKPVFTTEQSLIPALVYLVNMGSYFVIGIFNEYFFESFLMAFIFLSSLIFQMIVTLPYLRNKYLPINN